MHLLALSIAILGSDKSYCCELSKSDVKIELRQIHLKNY